MNAALVITGAIILHSASSNTYSSSERPYKIQAFLVRNAFAVAAERSTPAGPKEWQQQLVLGGSRGGGGAQGKHWRKP